MEKESLGTEVKQKRQMLEFNNHFQVHVDLSASF